LPDNERHAVGEAVVDLDTTRIGNAGAHGSYVDSIRFRDRAVGVGRDGELARAIGRIGREVVEPRDAVERHADDAGLRGLERVHVLRERVRLNVAALRVGRGIEVHDDVALLQGVREREVELLAGQRCSRREQRSRIALLQRRDDGQRNRDGCQTSEQ
jgi:hypothetical protein